MIRYFAPDELVAKVAADLGIETDSSTHLDVGDMDPTSFHGGPVGSLRWWVVEYQGDGAEDATPLRDLTPDEELIVLRYTLHDLAKQAKKNEPFVTLGYAVKRAFDAGAIKVPR